MGSRAQTSQSKSSGGGCGTLIAVAIVLGLLIEYWYVALGLVALAMAAWAIHLHRSRVRRRHRSGPKDPWLNELAVALLDLELREHGRNTGNRLGGAPMEGDLWLKGRGGDFWVNRFPTAQLARQAEMGLRANASFRQTLTSGKRAIQTRGCLLGVTRVTRGVTDDILLDEVMRVAARVPLETIAATNSVAALRTTAPPSDALSALNRLAALREAGVVTEQEFERKKRELLDRV